MTLGNNVMMQDTKGQVILYKNHLEVRLKQDTVWLTQKQMSDLFDKDTDTIGLHLQNIYKENELKESATAEESSVVQIEGNRQVRRKVRFYNLDAIISVATGLIQNEEHSSVYGQPMFCVNILWKATPSMKNG
jgi:hypothetical protein